MSEPVEEILKRNYKFVRKLPTGEWIGLAQMFFTVGLFVGLDESGYRYRYCYESWAEAFPAFLTWDGKPDAPGLWLVRKGLGHDIWNPNHPHYRDDV